MELQSITNLTMQTYQEISQKKILILYPRTPYKNTFLSYIMQQTNGNLVYCRASKSNNTLFSWLQDLSQQLQSEWHPLGTQLQESLASQSPTDAAQALANDLNQSQSPVVLYLDDMDYVEYDEQFNQFFIALVENITDTAKIVVSSRILRSQPWINLIQSGEAAVLGTERFNDKLMLTVQDEYLPPIEIYALGRGYAIADGLEITNWDGALPRNLFFYFVDNPLITRDEIFSVFWPKLSIKEATNVFHVTKRKISEKISNNVFDDGNYELTQYTNGFYKPSGKLHRYYDVHNFEEAVKKAMATVDEDEERSLLELAIALYRGPFLQDGTMEWMVERRKELRQLYSQALIGMGRLEKSAGDDMSALGFFIRALKETPEREDIHREVMMLYIGGGYVDQAKAQYRILENTLKDKLNIAPSKESRKLFDSIDG